MTGVRFARAVFTAMRAINTWWVWTARPFLLHPIATIRQWLEPEPTFTKEDLEGLTEGEIRALRGLPDVEPATIYKEPK